MNKKILISSTVALFLLLPLAFNVFAGQATSTNAAKNTNLVCAQAAVSKRETIMQSAFNVFSSFIGPAFQVRGEELAIAWGISDKAQRVAAIKKAWQKFQTNKKSAVEKFKRTKKGAWQQFKIDLKSCKVQSAGETEGADISF